MDTAIIESEQWLKKIFKPQWIMFYLIMWFVLYRWIDQPMTFFFYLHHSDTWTPWLLYISNMFVSTKFCIGLCVVLWLGSLVYHRFKPYKKYFQSVIGWLICTWTVTSILKIGFGQARPMLWIHDNIYGFFGPIWSQDYWAFPSGHTTLCTSLFLSLSMLFPAYVKHFLLIAFFISLLRVVLLYHYFSDVLITMLLVMGEWILFRYYVRHTRLKRWLA